MAAERLPFVPLRLRRSLRSVRQRYQAWVSLVRPMAPRTTHLSGLSDGLRLPDSYESQHPAGVRTRQQKTVRTAALPSWCQAKRPALPVGKSALSNVVGTSSPAIILTRSTLTWHKSRQLMRRAVRTTFSSDRNSRRWYIANAADAAMPPGRTSGSSHHGYKLHLEKFSIFSRCPTTSTSTIHHVFTMCSTMCSGHVGELS